MFTLNLVRNPYQPRICILLYFICVAKFIYPLIDYFVYSACLPCSSTSINNNRRAYCYFVAVPRSFNFIKTNLILPKLESYCNTHVICLHISYITYSYIHYCNAHYISITMPPLKPDSSLNFIDKNYVVRCDSVTAFLSYMPSHVVLMLYAFYVVFRWQTPNIHHTYLLNLLHLTALSSRALVWLDCVL